MTRKMLFMHYYIMNGDSRFRMGKDRGRKFVSSFKISARALKFFLFKTLDFKY